MMLSCEAGDGHCVPATADHHAGSADMDASMNDEVSYP
jgi:hypothetical protein